MKQKPTKVLLKLVNENTDQIEWTHLCYVDADLYNKYLEKFDITSLDLNEIMVRWVKETFNADMTMNKRSDLEALKGVIKDYYKRVYPEIFTDNSMDRQGWMRVFVTRKMKEDLGIYGE